MPFEPRLRSPAWSSVALGRSSLVGGLSANWKALSASPSTSPKPPARFLQILQLMIFLNMIIGLMNLLPIPVLDGGHLVFLLYEAVFRRPLPARVMEVALIIGLGLILTQFVYITVQDLVPQRAPIPGWVLR